MGWVEDGTGASAPVDAVSRRRFVVGAAGAGAAGAVIWAAPQMTSVALAQEVTPGSPPPDEPEGEESDETLRPTGEPEPPGGVLGPATGPATRPQPSSGPGPTTGVPPARSPAGDRTLPVTGSETRALVLAGAVGTVLGRALVGFSRALGADPADRPGR